MLRTCDSTVRAVRNSCAEIAWLVRPSAIRREHLALALGQLVQRVVLARAAHQQRDDLGVDDDVAGADAADRAGEVLEVVDAVLEQVAGAARAVVEQRERVVRLEVVGEHEHAGVRVGVLDAAREREALVGARRRHADVDHRDVGRVGVDEREQLVGVGGLPVDVEAGLGRAGAQGPRGTAASRRRASRAWELRDERRAAAARAVHREPASRRRDAVGEPAQAAAAALAGAADAVVAHLDEHPSPARRTSITARAAWA